MPERNFENRTLYHGDNLDFLKGINSGTVNLIATDPPFNKSKDFHATPDSLAAGASFTDRWRWDADVHQEWVDEIQDDYPGVWQAIENGRINHSEGMAAFLCWLGVRLYRCTGCWQTMAISTCTSTIPLMPTSSALWTPFLTRTTL